MLFSYRSGINSSFAFVRSNFRKRYLKKQVICTFIESNLGNLLILIKKEDEFNFKIQNNVGLSILIACFLCNVRTIPFVQF